MIASATTSLRNRVHSTSGLSIFALLLAVALALAISRLPVLVAGVGLAGIAALLLILVNPLFGLGLALLAGPLSALENIVLGPSLLDSGQVVLFLTVASWLAASMARRRVWVPPLALLGPWLLFLFVAALSLLGGGADLRLGLVELLKWVEIGLIAIIVVDLGTDGGQDETGIPTVARQVLGMLLLAGFVQALVGIWQFGLRNTGPEHFAVLGSYFRAYGSFEQPNPYGGYMNLTALLAIGVAWGALITVASLQRKEPNGVAETTIIRPPWGWLAVAGVVGVASSLAVIFSWSRGAWLGFLAGGAVLVLCSARIWYRGFLILSVAAIVGGGLLWAGVGAGFGPALSVSDRLLGFREDLTFGDVRGVDINDTNYAVIERLAHWQAAIGMAEEDIWLGAGFGNYEAAYPRFALINWSAPLGHAHNYYLNLLAETGVIGLTAYLLFWAVVVLQTLRGLRFLSWPDRGIALGLLAAWTALSVHHLVDKLYVNNVYIHLGVMLGLLQLLVGYQKSAQLSASGRIEDSAASS